MKLTDNFLEAQGAEVAILSRKDTGLTFVVKPTGICPGASKTEYAASGERQIKPNIGAILLLGDRINTQSYNEAAVSRLKPDVARITDNVIWTIDRDVLTVWIGCCS